MLEGSEEKSPESPYNEDIFKGFNEKLKKLSVPIVMKDTHRIEELRDLIEKTEDVYMEAEIEDYIGLLDEFSKEFKERISNNLKAKELSAEDVNKHFSQMIENAVVIGDSTPSYNCHGWSCGVAKWLELDKLTPQSFIDELVVARIQTRMLSSAAITDNPNVFFTNEKFVLRHSENAVLKDGSIVAYYEKGTLSHTARYLDSVSWYKYQEELHGGWYNKNNGMVNFDENGGCMVNNYTSKIGIGYLVVHNVEDILPLYGDTIECYESVD